MLSKFPKSSSNQFVDQRYKDITIVGYLNFRTNDFAKSLVCLLTVDNKR